MGPHPASVKAPHEACTIDANGASNVSTQVMKGSRGMAFDIRSLLVATALVCAVCAAARFLLWRMHPAMPGLLHWAWAGVVATGGLLLIAFHEQLPEILSLSAGQVLVAIALAVAWDGFRRFLGRPPVTLARLGGLVAGVVVLVALAHGAQSVPMRSLVNAAIMVLLSGAITWEIFRVTAGRTLALRATGVIYGLNTVFFVVRGVSSLTDTAEAVPLVSAGFYAFTLLWGLCVMLGVTLGMVLMASERLQDELDHQISRDPLTGTLNRRAFASLAEREVARTRRSGQPLALLMMDLDHFKQINDRLGHAAGDHYLQLFVSVAANALRAEDLLCRFGGEEFVALLPNTSADAALVVANRLRTAFAEAAGPAPATLPTCVTVSIGISEMKTTEPLENMLRRADHAMYQAKHNGRNRCEVAAALVPVPS